MSTPFGYLDDHLSGVLMSKNLMLYPPGTPWLPLCALLVRVQREQRIGLLSAVGQIRSVNIGCL